MGDKDFYSLFCGSCAIESRIISKNKTINDSHKYLIQMFKALQNGWIPPENISEQEYFEIKKNVDKSPELSGFVGFGCSFGGKWWGGYARYVTKNGNHARESKNSLMKKIKGLKDAKFFNKSYSEFLGIENAVIYLDPPYKKTTGYTNEVEFNHDEFWNWVRENSKNNLVFISEISAPKDFVSIWEKQITRQINHNDNFKSSEKLFVHESNYDKIRI